MCDLSANWNNSYRELEQRILSMEQKLDELSRCFHQTSKLLSQVLHQRNPETRWSSSQPKTQSQPGTFQARNSFVWCCVGDKAEELLILSAFMDGPKEPGCKSSAADTQHNRPLGGRSFILKISTLLPCAECTSALWLTTVTNIRLQFTVAVLANRWSGRIRISDGLHFSLRAEVQTR